jgi:hypothetical protein
MRVHLLSLFLLLSFVVNAQQKKSFVTGLITDEKLQPLRGASITLLGQNKGIVSNEKGIYNIQVPANKAFALIYSHKGFTEIQKNFFLPSGKTDTVNIILQSAPSVLEKVVVTDERKRKESGLINIEAKDALLLPSASGGVEGLIKTLVGSNNELSSQYSVRGGNFDENIIYINDFEIYRPYLVSNGQQEGLSFINPTLVKNINFYTGGFQSKYGDKMSSVLDIQYKKPTQFGGTGYVGLMEQGLSIYGTASNRKASYLIGARNRNNRNLLSNQPTVGNYIPSAGDIQSLLTYTINSKIQVEWLNIISQSRFTYYPESVKKTASFFTPFFTSNIGMDTYFEGSEKDSYKTSLTGLTIIHSPNSRLKLKWLAAKFTDKEKENLDISGAYLFGERDFDNNSNSFGDITEPLGSGYYQQYARNSLNITLYHFAHNGNYRYKKGTLLWGNSIEQTNITDVLKSFEYQDSAGYSLPYNGTSLQVFSYINSAAELKINKYSGFVQNNFSLNSQNTTVNLQAGVRYHYNDLNQQWLISPRFQASWKPLWKNNIFFHSALGIYSQPPFYRELRTYNGELNTGIRAQKSAQFTAGFDWQFMDKRNNPFRLTAEAYYKNMKDVVPYDIDNVKIRYNGRNNAKAYATGIEFRLFGELIKDAESWFSLAFMQTKENLTDDYYFDFINSSGEVINAGTTNQVAVDSVKQQIGYLRRPSDRLITAGLFLQDYLATNKNFKVHFNFLYGSNMPYNIPNSTRYRNNLIINSYIRADVGFSAQLLKDKNQRRSHSPFKSAENIWLSLEVFNLINKENTISYQLIKDFANNTYALPNRLTPRMLNLKLITRF